MKVVMPLFRRNNKSLKFDIVGLDDGALEEITALVVENGGKVVHDETQPVKFTKPYQFVQNAYPGSKLYDIEFIKQCIKENEIIDPLSYRIGQPMRYDDCVIAHFLGATNNCCISKVMGTRKTEPNTEDGAALKRIAGKMNGASRQVRHGSAMQKNDNMENNREPIDVESSNSSSDSIPDVKIELVRTPKRKFQSTDNENTLPVISEKRGSLPIKSHTNGGGKRGRGVAITRAEELEVLKYLTDHHMILEAATGLQVWNEMIKDGICRYRTANSLYSHFKKAMLPNIERYKLTEHQLKKFNKIKNM